jgi:hypothetical protein
VRPIVQSRATIMDTRAIPLPVTGVGTYSSRVGGTFLADCEAYWRQTVVLEPTWVRQFMMLSWRRRSCVSSLIDFQGLLLVHLDRRAVCGDAPHLVERARNVRKYGRSVLWNEVAGESLCLELSGWCKSDRCIVGDSCRCKYALLLKLGYVPHLLARQLLFVYRSKCRYRSVLGRCVTLHHRDEKARMETCAATQHSMNRGGQQLLPHDLDSCHDSDEVVNLHPIATALLRGWW